MMILFKAWNSEVFKKNNFVLVPKIWLYFKLLNHFLYRFSRIFWGLPIEKRERLGADHRKKRRCPPVVIVMPWELEKRPALPLRSSYYTNIVIALWHFAPYHSLNWLSVKLHAEIDSTHQDYKSVVLCRVESKFKSPAEFSQ